MPLIFKLGAWLKKQRVHVKPVIKTFRKSSKAYLLKLWPTHSKSHALFIKMYKKELVFYCLVSPIFLGISCYLFKMAFTSGVGYGILGVLIGLLFFIPWAVIPFVFIWLYKKSWMMMVGAAGYYSVFIIAWALLIPFINI
ncbi:hypothetical protein PU629_14805 [Pullulanibacillus sp. KACC 23026]|uniref:hypothetical protein n=1 Tax=Pullulanibacillus sp. KACC 23026 TaxID=3028315 RepID=UPI0023B15CD1|nr:hypothetical protein [Pullulanibacillus sp. KACC 23026]WEG11424.1 hypothetical protein PU629_14805 [Pullulanibacillus sp. KACC 23026]